MSGDPFPDGTRVLIVVAGHPLAGEAGTVKGGVRVPSLVMGRGWDVALDNGRTVFAQDGQIERIQP